MSREIRVLISWIGRTDLRCAMVDKPNEEPGPILRLLRQERFDEIHLLNDMGEGDIDPNERATPKQFVDWLIRRAKLDQQTVEIHNAPENLENQYGRIFEYTRNAVREIRDRRREEPARYALLLSSGYPAAQACLIVVYKTEFDEEAELFATSTKGVERVKLPFVVSVDVVPEVMQRWLDTHRVEISDSFKDIIGESRAIKLAKQKAQVAAAFADTSVLIIGETGTGKELFARAIHKASPRRDGKFMPINCAGMPEDLAYSELFGHKKGAFTDASKDRAGAVKEADGGTLFLDELADLPMKTQGELLRFLQEREYKPLGADTVEKADVRIVAATNRNLWKEVTAGRFREDLYYRLSDVEITLPPLRERGRDIELLARRFLSDWNEKHKTNKRWTKEALALLNSYPWRGNVRQLRQVVARSAIFSQGEEIRPEDVVRWSQATREAVGVPLRELSETELLTYLAAVLDELLGRACEEEQLSFTLSDEKNWRETVLGPLYVGRALRAAGNASRVRRLVDKSLDTSRDPARRWCDHYEQNLKSRIDEDLIRRLRGLD